MLAKLAQEAVPYKMRQVGEKDGVQAVASGPAAGELGNLQVAASCLEPRAQHLIIIPPVM